MSGSPVYLWDDNEPHVPGQGGKLIGAYAYGFPAVKECIVGVQPIELMLAAADRAALKRQAAGDDGVIGRSMKPASREPP